MIARDTSSIASSLPSHIALLGEVEEVMGGIKKDFQCTTPQMLRAIVVSIGVVGISFDSWSRKQWPSPGCKG